MNGSQAVASGEAGEVFEWAQVCSLSRAEQLEWIQSKVQGGTSGREDEEPDRVLTSVNLGRDGGVISAQIILDDKSPDGLRFYTRHERKRALIENALCDKLGMPRRHPPTAPANDNQPTITIPFIDPREWDGQPIPEREWFVPGLIPQRTVTLLSGEGGSGKTEIALQLIAASSLKTSWFGKPVTPGPCLYYGAEDEADELHRRFACIVEHAGKRLGHLDDVRLIPMADRDATLAAAPLGGRGKIQPTEILKRLTVEAAMFGPKLIVVDPAADVFGGDEINRAQVREFIALLRQLAISLDCAVLLLSHPSLTGINSGTGTSGSTAWHNSVRSRLYLEIHKTNGEPDSAARVLKVMKANYAATGAKINLRWHDGVYVVDQGPDPAVENVVHSKVDGLFLELLQTFTEQEQYLSPSPSVTYAPSRMAEHPKAKGYNKKQLAASMQRLLDAKRIRIESYGKPSRQQRRLAIAVPETGEPE